MAVTAKINNTGSEQTVSVNFTAGAPLTANSTLTAGTVSITVNNGSTNGTSLLTLKDAQDNPVTGLTDVALSVVGGAALSGLQEQVTLTADITTVTVRTVTATTGGAKVDNASTNILTIIV